ncbi:zinc ribbon domain-containing protein [Pseudovibrio brasiliensis]
MYLDPFMTELSPLQYLISVLITIAIGAIVGATAAHYKQRTKVGWLILCGLFPFMMFPLFCLPNLKQPSAHSFNGKTCPRCAETVKARAQVCRYCGHEFQLPKKNKQRLGSSENAQEVDIETGLVKVSESHFVAPQFTPKERL